MRFEGHCPECGDYAIYTNKSIPGKYTCLRCGVTRQKGTFVTYRSLGENCAHCGKPNARLSDALDNRFCNLWCANGLTQPTCKKCGLVVNQIRTATGFCITCDDKEDNIFIALLRGENDGGKIPK